MSTDAFLSNSGYISFLSGNMLQFNYTLDIFVPRLSSTTPIYIMSVDIRHYCHKKTSAFQLGAVDLSQCEM